MTDTIYILHTDAVCRMREAYAKAHFPARYDRAQRCRPEAERRRLLAAGCLLWEVLGVEESALTVGTYGKLSAPGKPAFNLSHSGVYTVLAVSDADVGVDIECLARRCPPIAERVFTAEEQAWLQGAPQERFWTLWTMKEAAGKAIGMGLQADFRRFSVLPLLRGEAIELAGTCLYGSTWCIDGYALSAAGTKKTKMQIRRYCRPED